MGSGSQPSNFVRLCTHIEYIDGLREINYIKGSDSGIVTPRYPFYLLFQNPPVYPSENCFTHRDLARQLITSHILSDNTPFPSGISRIFLFFITPGFSHHFPPLGGAANQARFS